LASPDYGEPHGKAVPDANDDAGMALPKASVHNIVKEERISVKMNERAIHVEEYM